MVCAPSNCDVDKILERVVKIKSEDFQPDIIRIGDEAKMSDTAKKYSLTSRSNLLLSHQPGSVDEKVLERIIEDNIGSYVNVKLGKTRTKTYSLNMSRK